ncbi:VanZ family protein [Eubacterium uniforme]|nr:VanZ family protein [Eubacterium uniforme]
MVKVVVMPIVLLNAVSRHDFIKHLGRKVIYGIQTIPFQTIKSNLTPITFAGIIQIFGNIILLMPVAIIIVWIIEEKNIIFVLSLGLFVSIIVEGMQYIINALTLYPSHEVDVDDLILNYLGYILMIGVIYIIKRKNINVYNKVRKMFVINE